MTKTALFRSQNFRYALEHLLPFRRRGTLVLGIAQIHRQHVNECRRRYVSGLSGDVVGNHTI